MSNETGVIMRDGDGGSAGIGGGSANIGGDQSGITGDGGTVV